MRLMALAAVGLTVLGMVPAMADEIQYHASLNQSDYPSDGDRLGINLPAFNTSLGTLTGVTYSVGGGATDTMIGEIGDSTPYIATFANTGDLYAVGVTTVNTPLASSTAVGSTLQIINNFALILSATVDPAALKYYILGDVNQVEFSAFGIATDTATGQRVGYSDDKLSFNGFVTETFTYTPVPEPGTMGLMLAGIVGMIGLTVIRRRA